MRARIRLSEPARFTFALLALSASGTLVCSLMVGCGERANAPAGGSIGAARDRAATTSEMAPSASAAGESPPMVYAKSAPGMGPGGAMMAGGMKQGSGLADRAPAGESYAQINDNAFRRADKDPLSTFAVDVDTASYANVRRFLNQGGRPPADAVRIEELVNYFKYNDPQPEGDAPFSINVEVARCPWNAPHRLVRIGLKGREVKMERRPPSNLVFLVDVSGSMASPDKLPLLKSALKMLVEQLGENDRVAVVVYAGAEGLALPSTPGSDRGQILATLEHLQSGGSTNGGAGIQLAYHVARENFVQGGTNRVILASDGDFNVGITDRAALIDLIQQEAKSGVFLSVLGFGQGNLQDATMEQLADKGNGNYSYIDSAREARKVLVEQVGGTLLTIAKDVKVQVQFNPEQVATYRLIGYENRVMQNRDFRDDSKDAGEIGAGHTVTALYEVVPKGQEATIPTADGAPTPDAPADDSVAEPEAGPTGDALLTVRLRYKAPDGDEAREVERTVEDEGTDYAEASDDFKFAAAVAEFGMVLRDSPYRGESTLAAVAELAQVGLADDPNGYRAEFVELVGKARSIAGR